MGNTKLQDFLKWVRKKEICKHNHTHTHTQILTWFYCLVFFIQVSFGFTNSALSSLSLPQLPFCKFIHFLLLSFDLFCFTFPYFFLKKYLFLLTSLGLYCGARAFSSCSKWVGTLQLR